MSGYIKFSDTDDGGGEESIPEEVAKVAKVAKVVELQGINNAKVVLKFAKVPAKVPLCAEQAPSRAPLPAVSASPLDAPRRPPKPLCRHRWIQDGRWVRCPACGVSHPGKIKGERC